jgi:Subtilisin inhibitor-like
MRGIVVLALAGLLLTVGTSAGAQVQRQTSLTIIYWPEGVDSSGRLVWTLRCNPAGGTHPRPVVSCRRLSADTSWTLFRPIPKAVACTEIYGGPQVARAVGMLEGRKVWARFTRTNGCQISRWDKLSPWLLPAGSVR